MNRAAVIEFDSLEERVIAGLKSESQKCLPVDLLYEAARTRYLSDRVLVPEYHGPLAEEELLAAHQEAIAFALGAAVVLIDYGCGNGQRALALLRTLQSPLAYVPVEIASELTVEAANAIESSALGIRSLPVVAPFTEDFQLPDSVTRLGGTRVVALLGIKVGNLELENSIRLLRHAKRKVGLGGQVLVSVDLVRDIEAMERAYDDPKGVSAAFHLELLHHLNSGYGADFDPRAFTYTATWCHAHSRMDSYLISLKRQSTELLGRVVKLEAGETIQTAFAYKFTLEMFGTLAELAGLDVANVWQNPDRTLALFHLTAG